MKIAIRPAIFLSCTIVAASVALSAEAHSFTVPSSPQSFRTWLFGTGSGTDEDRDSALDQAADDAQQQLNNSCVGTIYRVERTGSSCMGGPDLGGAYTCLVYAKGLCGT